MKAVRTTSSGTLYAIRLGDYVKVGHTTFPVERRAASLRYNSPHDPEILWTSPGGGYDEYNLHCHLRAHWVRREWFKWSDRLLIDITEWIRPSKWEEWVEQPCLGAKMLREWRGDRSQREVSAILDMHMSQYNAHEHGRRRVGLKTARKFHEIAGIPWEVWS